MQCMILYVHWSLPSLLQETCTLFRKERYQIKYTVCAESVGYQLPVVPVKQCFLYIVDGSV